MDRVLRRVLALLVAFGASTAGAGTLHHINVYNLSGYTSYSCRSPVLTVEACSDATCSTKFTDGLTVSFRLERSGGPANGVGESDMQNGGTVTIAPGSSTGTMEINANVAGSWRLYHVSSTPSYGYMYCNGYTGSSCPHSVAAETYSMAASTGYTTPYAGYAYYSEVAFIQQGSCGNYFASVSPVPYELECFYSNPTTGFVSPSALLTEPATGATKWVYFNSSNSYNQPCGGISNITVAQNGGANVWMRQWIYEDTGRVQIRMTHRGVGKKQGFVASATYSNVWLPSHFEFTSMPASTIVAGSTFNMNVRAMAGSVLARSFGNETGHVPPSISFARVTPTGTGASNGTATATVGNFANGYGTVTGASWSEVGTGDFSLAQTSMLGQPYITSYYVNNGRGTTKVGAKSLGPFQPYELRATASSGCGTFTYSGQSFPLQVEAVNLQGSRTVNYDGTGTLTPKLAHALTGDVSLGGGASSPLVGVTQASFVNGLSNTTPLISLQTLPSPPTAFAMSLRTSTNDPATGQPYVKTNTPSTGTLRLGRLAMTDASADSTSAAVIALQSQYWTGSTWAQASDDGCTTLTAANFGIGSSVNSSGSAASSAVSIGALNFANGSGSLNINPPSDTSSAVVTIAANLGSSASSNTCSGVQPSATGSGKSHLRSKQACSAGAWGIDPAASVSFGMPRPRSKGDIWLSDRR